MCTAIVSVDPASPVPVLLVGVRDEFLTRAWEPPGRHWPDRPGLVGGRDLQAGGTWLAVDPEARRAATILNGRGPLAPEDRRRSRGDLPLLVAAGGTPDDLDLKTYDPFFLLGADPGGARMWSWDGADLTGRDLGPGLHIVVNNGLNGEGHREGVVEDAFMAARLAHLRPLLAAAPRPAPRPGGDVRDWSSWLAELEGGGLDRSDRRTLLPLHEFEPGRVWGTTSVSLVGLAPDLVRYDFSARPGDPSAWTTVL
ncbi:NRDE family protein [Actinomadura rupiterrae]|uniref:NRDE family protein n=1 Tax=Actinomadura rupiterrae TaxID=559627 RepID=UPI0020A32CEF|nr:NRDE family protein [Actinomadura rupiterrae]MCP2341492.1 hypothetical protein [Actinomadura rupiterrae]